MTDLRIWQRKGLLHWERPGANYFVTFRLEGSVPKPILDEYRRQIDSKLPLARQMAEERKHIERFLDQQTNALLSNKRCAEIVRDVMLREHGSRYEMIAWVVMPNHVHSVFSLNDGVRLDEVLQQWKSVSAHHINKLLNLRGRLWQKEYFDRIVRNEEMLARVVRYVKANPEKAGLKNWEFVG